MPWLAAEEVAPMPLIVPRFALLRRRKVVRTITLPGGARR